ncbi:MAG: S1 RNA-binding domain-containing protein [Acidobacteriota bacterium]|nr:S1 RNA-binding domain-containing protein [Acidobacteriota bacterium]
MSEPEVEDFAAMFEASVKTKRFSRGQAIEGTIVAIGPDTSLVNVGGKGEAVIETADLKDHENDLEFAVGDRIQAIVVGTTGGITLSRKGIRGAASLLQLENAYQAWLSVEGKIEREVKGGYEVRVAGQRGFCPFSQIDTVRATDPAQHIGQTYAFRIIEFKEGGKNLVVSRRALLEDEQKAGAAVLRQSLAVGDTVTGRVASVREFGAFVDLGAGVQGLLHVSEMGWSRVTDPSSVVKVGEEITVRVLRVDNDGERIALGLKQLLADPWVAAASSYEVGQVKTGRITRIADFGAFVELEPGVEALAHFSTFAPTGRQEDWKRTVTVGLTAPFEIVAIDVEKKRIGVAMVQDGAEIRDGKKVDEVKEYRDRQVAAPTGGIGSLADQLRGALKK